MLEEGLSNAPFAEVIVPRSLRSLFTYSVPPEMRLFAAPGKRVLVPFGPRKLIGLLARRVSATTVDSRPILQVIDESPVAPAKLVELALWAASHYFAAPGDVAPMLLPRGDVKLDTIVELDSGAEPPDARSKAARMIYDALETKGGSRRLELLAADLGVSAGELDKTLSRESVSRIAKRIQAARPVSSRQVREEPRPGGECAEPVELTDQQKQAADRIYPDMEEGRFNVHLIHGVTGSGKTEVYASLVSETLKLGKSALVMAPEIALADMLAERLKRRLGLTPVTLHSDMPPRERDRRWMSILEGEARLVVGARSAVWAPLPGLGLIIVDEEHDPSYKQDTAPRYNGRDVAIKRGSMESVPVVLGSATPSLESYHHAIGGKYGLIELETRVDGRPLPKVEVIKPEQPGEIGQRLKDEIASRLEAGEQTLLFINRRGFARFVQCESCGHVLECRNCALSLVNHAATKSMKCHTCGYSEPAPDICPKCHSTRLFMGGSGSEKIEREVSRLFPSARVARMDRDTTSRRNSSSRILKEVGGGKVDILVGTQMITKGHDYPGITLVGAVSADETLRLPDFRSAERTFQLITQAAGRAGRGSKGGLVIAQTLSEGHHSVMTASRHDFKAFYELESPLREAAGYPPYCRLALVKIDASTLQRGEAFVQKAAAMLAKARSKNPEITVLGPVESVIFKVKNRYNWRALLKAPAHSALASALNIFLSGVEAMRPEESRGVRVVVDMDPASVM